MLTLHNLKHKKSTSPRKRLGRGNSSGRGNYSTRGMKGQRARSGGKSGLQSRSIKGYLLRIPKTRGFQSIRPSFATVNLRYLESNFSAGDKINIRSLLKAGLIQTTDHGVKILSMGKLTKKFTVEANAFSKEAIVKITKAGGQAVVIDSPKVAEKRLAKTKKEAPAVEILADQPKN